MAVVRAICCSVSVGDSYYRHFFNACRIDTVYKTQNPLLHAEDRHRKMQPCSSIYAITYTALVLSIRVLAKYKVGRWIREWLKRLQCVLCCVCIKSQPLLYLCLNMRCIETQGMKSIVKGHNCHTSLLLNHDMIISPWILFRMRIISDRSCRGNQNTHFMFSTYLPKILPFMRYCGKIWYSQANKIVVFDCNIYVIIDLSKRRGMTCIRMEHSFVSMQLIYIYM
jgi:hypothetical protein